MTDGECYYCIGEVAEWSNAAVLKTVASQGALGSNPSLSVFYMGQVRKIGNTYYVEFYARGLLYSQIAGPDRAVAQKLLEDIEAKIAGGESLTIVRDIDLPVFLEQFLNDAARQYPPKTLKRLRLTASHFSAFSQKSHPQLTKLSQVTPAVIESYKACLAQGRDVNPKKVNLTLLLLREILEYGIKTGFINDNPTVHVHLLPMPAVPRVLTARGRMVKDLLSKGVLLGRISILLKMPDIARLMYYANLIPLSREDMYN